MSGFVLTAVGHDRPGIVAAVTSALSNAGANLADSSMTILRGQFAILLVLDAPDGTNADDLRAALAAPAADLGLVVDIQPVDDADAADAHPAADWTVTVHGADRPGIVSGITGRLAAAGASVVDLRTHVVGSAERPVYVLALDIALGGTDAETLRTKLRDTAAGLGVECSIQPADPDML